MKQPSATTLALMALVGLVFGCGRGAAPRLESMLACGAGPDYLALSPDRRQLAVTCGAKRELWLLQPGHPGKGPAVLKTGKNPGGLLYSPDGKKLFVCETGADTLAQVSLKDGRVARHIAAGSAPREAFYSEDDARFFITCLGAAGLYDAPGTPPVLSVIRTQDLRHEKDLDLGGAGFGAKVSRKRAQAYLAVTQGNALAILYLPDRSLLASVGVHPRPKAVALSLDGAFAYVACAGSLPEEGEASSPAAQGLTGQAEEDVAPETVARESRPGAVSIVRLRDRQVVDTIVVGAGASDICLSPSGRYLYVICADMGTLEIASTLKQERVCRFGLPGKPGHLVVDEKKIRAYVSIPKKNAVAVLDVSMFP